MKSIFTLFFLCICMSVFAHDPSSLTVTKTSNSSLYIVGNVATFTITIQNDGASGVTIDRITDELPSVFTYRSLHTNSQLTAANSTATPSAGATGVMSFDGGVLSGSNSSYYIPAGGSFVLQYTATAVGPGYNQVATARIYEGTTEVGSAQSSVSVAALLGMGTLPVKLVSFSAAWKQSQVQLQWSTSSEFNTRSVVIERSANSLPFAPIGEVNAAGQSTIVRQYGYTDSFPAAGIIQYRLKFTDLDAKTTYSPIVALHKSQTGITLQPCYPVPTMDILNVPVSADKQQSASIRLTDMNGKLVQSQTVNCISGTNLFVLRGLDALPGGMYVLQLITPGRSQQQAVMKR